MLAGATVTSLAAWIDEEWVTAGVDGVAGVHASEFEIEQLVAGVDEEWTNHESVTDMGVVSFDDVAANLSPGAIAYGWVSLRAAADSVGGDLVIKPATDTLTGALESALRYSAWLHSTNTTCNEDEYADEAIMQLVDDQAVNVGSGATSFELERGAEGSPGTDKTVCFAITLPAGASVALQGENASVAWYFEATSD